MNTTLDRILIDVLTSDSAAFERLLDDVLEEEPEEYERFDFMS